MSLAYLIVREGFTPENCTSTRTVVVINHVVLGDDRDTAWPSVSIRPKTFGFNARLFYKKKKKKQPTLDALMETLVCK